MAQLRLGEMRPVLRRGLQNDAGHKGQVELHGAAPLHRQRRWSPRASLIFDADYKHLYGTTAEGGPGGYSVVFEITP
jgi:hypothetical protein